jgi:hypothetical protein
MNLDKAREYYSDYFEGSLEPGLKNQFERQLNDHAEVREDYEAFVQAMSLFDDIREDDVEVPFDLHDKILARVDHHIWEKERSKPKGIGAWWRTLAVGGVAALGIIGTLYTLVNRSNGGENMVSGVGIINGGQTAPAPQFTANGSQLMLNLPAAAGTEMQVLLQNTGAELSKVKFSEPSVSAPIKFTGAGGELVKIVFTRGDKKSETIVALPGGSAEATGTNSTIAKLGLAMAARYKVPVLVPLDKLNESISFELRGTSAKEAPTSTISDNKVTVESRGGLIVILSPK